MRPRRALPAGRLDRDHRPTWPFEGPKRLESSAETYGPCSLRVAAIGRNRDRVGVERYACGLSECAANERRTRLHGDRRARDDGAVELRGLADRDLLFDAPKHAARLRAIGEHDLSAVGDGQRQIAANHEIG